MNPSAPDPIAIALAEDIGTGDLTTQYFVPAPTLATARIVARERAVVAGTEIAADVFRRVDPTLEVKVIASDGHLVERGASLLEIEGAAASILTAERVALNFLQRLSGIATLTRQFVDAIAGTPARILDTRKTTPGLRALEKAAVAAGGGLNHRFGLYDMVLVKDNHLLANQDFAGVAAALARVRREHPAVRVELEADTLEQVRRFLEMDGVDVILLDNMTPADLRAAVALRGNRPVKFEASGGVRLQTVREIAEAGVDYISVGALTHSARAIDLSLELTHAAS